MFDMSWGEVMVIGAVALIVIGPKDLPKALRTVGHMTGKIRRMAAEFQGQFNEAMREAELDDVKQQLQGMNNVVSLPQQGLQPDPDHPRRAEGRHRGSRRCRRTAPAETRAGRLGAGQRRSAIRPRRSSRRCLALPAVPPIVDPRGVDRRQSLRQRGRRVETLNALRDELDRKADIDEHGREGLMTTDVERTRSRPRARR